jgi:hypothetical protein
MMSAAKPAKHNTGQDFADFKAKEEREAYDDTAAETGAPARKKQKRNKPTLSCEECVERKTKVRFSFSSAFLYPVYSRI